jgi:SPX domain protein involved in polyphosphate accumulation
MSIRGVAMVEMKAISGPPAKKTGDRMLACRYELKYLINEVQTAQIERYVQPYLEYDRYSKLQRDGYYCISSLYLDSADLRLCRETLTGQKNRFKLRIRSYTDEPEYPRFFEIKRRLNCVILKSRARVTEDDVPTLLKGRLLPPHSYHTDEASLNQFQLYVASIKAGPMVLIRYMRKAYESTSENRVRVTFDRELCYKVTDEPRVRLGGSGWQHNIVTDKYVVLEIKFTGTYPLWLSRMVASLNLKLGSMSKYATSIQQACALGFCAPVRRSLLNG